MSITDIEREAKRDETLLAHGIITRAEYNDRCKERLSDLLSSVMSEPQDDEGLC